MQQQAQQVQHVFVRSNPSLDLLLQAISKKAKELAEKEQASRDSQATLAEIQAREKVSVTGDLENPSGLHVDPLTNAPIGYDLAQRHPTEDIALYVRETGSLHPHFVIIGGGVLIASDDPVGDFELIRQLKPEYVHKYINGQMGLPKSDDLPKRYIGVYRNITTGDGDEKCLLWAIFNTDALIQSHRARNPGYTDQEILVKVKDSVIKDYDGVVTGDTREELPSEMPYIFQ